MIQSKVSYSLINILDFKVVYYREKVSIRMKIKKENIQLILLLGEYFKVPLHKPLERAVLELSELQQKGDKFLADHYSIGEPMRWTPLF